MKNKLNILILEDVATDAELIELELRKEKIAFSSKRVDTKTDFLRELKDFNPDLILSDYMLPQFDGMTALWLVKELAPSIPFIMVTGSMNEETAVECLKAGAADYVIKEHLARIGPGVRAALENKQTREKKEKAEKALRLSAQEWQTTFNAMSDGICIIGVERKIRRANQTMTNILKKPLSEILGHECNILLHGTSKPIKNCPFMRMRISKKREIFGFQKGEHWYNCTVDPILDKTGNLIGAAWCLSDITERKAAEEALRESEEFLTVIVENIPNMIFVKDAKEHRFIRFNKAGEELLGYSRKELIGKTDYDFFTKDEAEYFVNKDREVLKKEKIKDIPEEIIQTRHLGKRILHTKKIPILDKQRKPLYLLGISEDITEHKNLEDQLIKAQKMEAIGRLTGGIAHDFNNILTAIIGFSDYLLMKLDKNDFSYTYLKEISEAGKRAASLTHQLLAFSRKQILQPSVLNINIMISDMDKMLHRIIGEDIDLVTNLEPDLGNVKIDPSQIEQVIMNLAVNAKDAMSQGGKLTIETANVYLDEEYARQHSTVEPGHYVMLAVSDNGIGMDEETQDKIFEPFFSTKEKDKGTGLGLSTVYGIIKQSGGGVGVYSEPGKGTSFKIYFPRVMEKIGLKKATKPHIQSIQGTEAILVVEDYDLVREMVANSLKTLGYSILEAKNGEDALRYFKKERKQSIDLIVTDIVMPQMSGGEFIKKLRGKDINTKVLLISGYTDNSIVHHGILDEGIPYLQKPFTMNDLGKKVREVLDSA